MTFEKVKEYYDKGLWTIKRVRDAVNKGVITKTEYQNITGEIY